MINIVESMLSSETPIEIYPSGRGYPRKYSGNIYYYYNNADEYLNLFDYKLAGNYKIGCIQVTKNSSVTKVGYDNVFYALSKSNQLVQWGKNNNILIGKNIIIACDPSIELTSGFYASRPRYYYRSTNVRFNYNTGVYPFTKDNIRVLFALTHKNTDNGISHKVYVDGLAFKEESYKNLMRRIQKELFDLFLEKEVDVVFTSNIKDQIFNFLPPLRFKTTLDRLKFGKEFSKLLKYKINGEQTENSGSQLGEDSHRLYSKYIQPSQILS